MQDRKLGKLVQIERLDLVRIPPDLSVVSDIERNGVEIVNRIDRITAGRHERKIGLCAGKAGNGIFDGPDNQVGEFAPRLAGGSGKRVQLDGGTALYVVFYQFHVAVIVD